MKYKPGQKVILKKDLVFPRYSKEFQNTYNNLNLEAVTILEITPRGVIFLKEIKGDWTENEIVGIYTKPERIHSRFDILDL